LNASSIVIKLGDPKYLKGSNSLLLASNYCFAMTMSN